LPDYKANIHNRIGAMRSPADGGLGKAAATFDEISKELSEASQAKEPRKVGKGKEPLPVQVSSAPRTPSEYVRAVVGPLTGILETTTIVIVFTLFILIKREDLRNRLLRLAGSGQLNVMTKAMDDASARLSRYLLMQFVVNVSYGLLFGLGLYGIGIPHPLLWGVLSSLLRFIPYIGTPVATVFPIALALAVFPGWHQVGLTLALFLFLEIATANFIEPWLYGSHTGISSLAILVAAIFWGMLWGPMGLILSTPLTVCLILAGRYVPQLNFLEIILGDEPVLSPQAHFYQRLLALDDDEAREIAETYLKDHSLDDLYETVMVAALRLAEQDRHTDALDDNRTAFIYRGTEELVEELYELTQSETPGASCAMTPQASGPLIVCVPARDKADEIVGTMAAQLFWRGGYNAQALPIAPASDTWAQLESLNPNIVCVSALPPFAAGQAKSMCKQIRQHHPAMKIVLGLWQFPGGLDKARERVGSSCANLICTSVAKLIMMMVDSQLLPAATPQMADSSLEQEVESSVNT
jgi:predicted PurR-regulated permease PerM